MKHIIILGDGMADHPIERLDGMTPLQCADTPYMDRLAREGRAGMLHTVPDGYPAGSEVANTAILGYDLNEVYEGRGPLEAASIGYEMDPLDMAIRCNIITLDQGRVINHHGGHLTDEQGAELINYLQEHLGDDVVRFIPGVQYRQLLVIRGGSKYIECAPPHDHPDEEWRSLLVKPMDGMEELHEEGRMTPRATADLINQLILRSQELLAAHPFNAGRKVPANSIWPWSPGYRPHMLTLSRMYPQVKSGAMISAVDLMRGIGHYAGLEIIKVPGVTGQYDTNYEGKVEAAIDTLRRADFVYLHVEASDEAGHDGNLELKLRTISDLDSKVVGPIIKAVEAMDEDVAIAVLPDHPTPVEVRTHVDEPVPFVIWHKGITPDSVTTFDERACAGGSYGMLRLNQFMNQFMSL